MAGAARGQVFYWAWADDWAEALAFALALVGLLLLLAAPGWACCKKAAVARPDVREVDEHDEVVGTALKGRAVRKGAYSRTVDSGAAMHSGAAEVFVMGRFTGFRVTLPDTA